MKTYTVSNFEDDLLQAVDKWEEAHGPIVALRMKLRREKSDEGEYSMINLLQVDTVVENVVTSTLMDNERIKS